MIYVNDIKSSTDILVPSKISPNVVINASEGSPDIGILACKDCSKLQ